VDREQIASWLREKLARALKIREEAIDGNAPFSDYGLDSATEISLVGELNELLGADLDPELFWDYPTIEELSDHLSRIAGSGG
jgi:acyl carrier protein